MSRKTTHLIFTFGLLAVFIFVHITLFAQENTTQLDEVEITANQLTRFGVGAYITELDSGLFENYGRQSLSDVIAYGSSVYIKQYGSGQLATVSFRGTGAGHTSLQWNGLPVGYPFLGQADLSLVPMEFIDQVCLMHGSSSARYGSGAVGGVVDLSNEEPPEGFGILVDQSVGSFSTSNSFVQLHQAGPKGYIRVGSIYNRSENDFKVRSSNGESLGRQANANYFLTGGLLEAGYNLGSTSSLTLSFQNTDANRNLQSSIGAPTSNNQKDRNMWSSLHFKHQMAKGEFNLTYGHLFDRINYNSSVTDSHQNIAQATLLYDVSGWLEMELGINSNWIRVVTPNYESNEARETRTDMFASATIRPTKRVEASINLRQSVATGYSVPFTPSLGISYLLHRKENWKFMLRGQVSKGYRVPTLNDRFWVPGGNPDLNPEESVSTELGINIDKGQGFWTNITTYQMWVDNWILWQDQGAFWSPDNVLKVEGKGVELEIGYRQNAGRWQTKYWLNYAYTKSTNIEPRYAYDRTVGKQLPYVPFHNGNANIQLAFKNWNLLLNGQFTGKRFITTDNVTEVSGYALLNLRVSKQLSWDHWAMNAYGNINNATNTNYQTISNRAMPGINFLLGINISFNK
ncbi:MAG: TonB-dependent receptor [Cyclobacteriaceae bacterium]|nr:TonB-dependent receptor [Cyclobacteriaceae bacterium]